MPAETTYWEQRLRLEQELGKTYSSYKQEPQHRVGGKLTDPLARAYETAMNDHLATYSKLVTYMTEQGMVHGTVQSST